MGTGSLGPGRCEDASFPRVNQIQEKSREDEALVGGRCEAGKKRAVNWQCPDSSPLTSFRRPSGSSSAACRGGHSSDWVSIFMYRGQVSTAVSIFSFPLVVTDIRVSAV